MSESKQKKTEGLFRLSISNKMLFLVLLLAFVLSVTAIVIAYRVYSKTMDDHYLTNTIRLANTASALVDHETVEKYSTMILSRYLEASEEERADQDGVAYRSRFSGIEENDDYQQLRLTLIKIVEENDIAFGYLMVIDKAREVCLYIADGDTNEDTYCPPGVWEPIEPEQADMLRSGREAVITNEEYGWLSSSGSPICGSEDGTFSAAIVEISMNEVMQDRHDFLLNFCVVLLLVIGLLSALITWMMHRQVVVPINKLSKAVSEYSYDRAHQMDSHPVTCNHFSGLNIHTGDELENLSNVMDDLESQLAAYIDNLTQVTAEKERIGVELNVAARIQADMLPRIFPPFPDREEFDLYAAMNPAKEVGGDFYDFFMTDENHLAVVMADVSGKGVPAALFMMMGKTVLRDYAERGDAPADVVRNANSKLCEGNEAEMFITAWMGFLDTGSGLIRFVNAGHNPPVLIRGGEASFLTMKSNMVLAAWDGFPYCEDSFRLLPGDLLYLYTDGVTEAMNDAHELYGDDRLIQALSASFGEGDTACRNVCSAVKRELTEFVGSAPQFDDITMLCLYYGGPDSESGES